MALEVIDDWNNAHGNQYGGQRQRRQISDMLESKGAQDTTDHEGCKKRRQHDQLLPIGNDVTFEWTSTPVPVQKSTDFNAEIGYHACQMSCAHDSARYLCDYRVLKSHHEAEKHHGKWDKESLYFRQSGPTQA